MNDNMTLKECFINKIRVWLFINAQSLSQWEGILDREARYDVRMYQQLKSVCGVSVCRGVIGNANFALIRLVLRLQLFPSPLPPMFL